MEQVLQISRRQGSSVQKHLEHLKSEKVIELEIWQRQNLGVYFHIPAFLMSLIYVRKM